MPIRPENRGRYPKDWPQVRERIGQRSGWRCECTGECGRGTHEGRCANVHGGEAYGTGSKVVLTVAHLGLPSHMPVFAHVTPAAETSEIVNVVGFLMPCQTELDKWPAMMHYRTITELGTRSAASSAPFIVSFPRRSASSRPRSAIAANVSPMPPESILLTGWRLLGKPVETACIATESAPLSDVVTADLVRLSTTFALSYGEGSLATTYPFIATGRRASNLVIRSLLRRECEWFSADHAVPDGRAFSREGHSAILYHLDEYPEHCDDSNLRHMCQGCHLHYDRDHHAQTRRTNRRAFNQELPL